MKSAMKYKWMVLAKSIRPCITKKNGHKNRKVNGPEIQSGRYQMDKAYDLKSSGMKLFLEL